MMTRRTPTAASAGTEFGCRMADAIAGTTSARRRREGPGGRRGRAMEGHRRDDRARRAPRGPGRRRRQSAKPGQDMRFDVPVVGLATIEAMRRPAPPRSRSMPGDPDVRPRGLSPRPTTRGLRSSAGPPPAKAVVTGRRRRVAVVGVGHLGRHHARVLSALPEVTLAGVVDPTPSRARGGGGRVRAPGAGRATTCRRRRRGLCGGSHRGACRGRASAAGGRRPRPGREADDRSLAEADRLLAAAAQSGALLAVGHIERFNPAVQAAAPAHPRAAVHRGPSARHVPRAQPRHRRGLRPDDPRPRPVLELVGERGRPRSRRSAFRS